MTQNQQPGAGELLDAAVLAFTEQVDAMRDEDWSRPSPCQGWDGHQVLDHVSDTLTGILGMLSGADYRETKEGEGARTASPQEAVTRWHDLGRQARTAAASLDPSRVLSGPMGEGPAAVALKIPTHDLTVHAWDLAATAGRRWEIPELLRSDLEQLVVAIPPEVLRSPGLFGPEVPAPENAGKTDRLMAFLGRRRPE